MTVEMVMYRRPANPLFPLGRSVGRGPGGTLAKLAEPVRLPESEAEHEGPPAAINPVTPDLGILGRSSRQGVYDLV